MSFSEISIYQVRPDKVEEFEAMMQDAGNRMKAMEGCQTLRLL